MKWKMGEEEEAYLDRLPEWLKEALEHLASGKSQHLVLPPLQLEELFETRRWYKGVVARDSRFVNEWIEEL